MTSESWAFLKQCLEAFQAIALAWIVYKTALMTRNIRLLEKNTNSIKDELVSVTRTSSHAKGVLDEKTRHEKEK